MTFDLEQSPSSNTTAESAAHMRLQIVVISFMSDARRVYG